MDAVTRNAPQPGETPRTEGNPWSFDPDAAWWRGDGDAEQAGTPAEAAGGERHPRRPPAPTAPAAAGPAAEASTKVATAPTAPTAPTATTAPGGARPAAEAPTQLGAATTAPGGARPTAEARTKLGAATTAPGGARPTAEARTKLATAPADGRRGQPPRRKPRAPHRAGPGLIALITFGLVTAFFSWVSAEPFWLAVGHGDPGVATVARCSGSGIVQRCTGSFAAADGSYRVRTVTLLGVDAAHRDPESTGAAWMVNPNSRQAYVGTAAPLVHLRWVLGFALVLICGFAIAVLTGTRQLETLRARRGALLMCVAAPLLLLAGFLFATY
jgi:hypothetical protein